MQGLILAVGLWGPTLGSPRQSPESIPFGFSGGANTGAPAGKLVSQPQVVTRPPSASLGLEKWKGHD